MKKVFFLVATLSTFITHAQLTLRFNDQRSVPSIELNANDLKLSDESAKAESETDDRDPSIFTLSLNTGLIGNPTYAGGDETKWGAPLMIFSEKSGRIGRFHNLPNYFFYGAYFRWSKQRYGHNNLFGDPDFSSSSRIIGFGVRGSLSIIPAIRDLMDNENDQADKLDVYCGFQAGYDIVSFNGYVGYYGYTGYNYGYNSGLRVNPFAGVRYYPLKWLGVHAEVGATSNRLLTLGLIVRKSN